MVRNVLSNWVGFLVTGIVHLVLTPILIHHLGDFNYGIWVLVISVLSYYGLLDLGMHTALLRFVAKAKGEDDRRALNEILGTSLVIAASVAAVVMVLTGVLVWVGPGFLKLSNESQHAFRWVLLLLGAGVAVTFLTRSMGNYLCGLHRFDLYNGAKIATSILRASLILLFLSLGYGLVGLASGTLASSLMALPLHWVLVRRADPSMHARACRAKWARARMLMGFGFFSFLGTLGNYARFYLDSLVIVRVLTVALVTPFSIATQMVEYLRLIMIGVMSPLITSFSHLVGEKTAPEQFRETLTRATRFTSLLSLFIGSMLILNGQQFIALWVGERFLPSYQLLVILVAGYVLMLAQTPSHCLFYAMSKHRAMAAWTLGEGLVNLVLSVYLAGRYGLVGVALGTAIPMAVVALLIQPWYALRLVGLSAWAYVRDALARPVAVVVIFLALCMWGAGTPAQGSPYLLVWRVLWQSGLYAVLAFTVGLRREDYPLLAGHFRQFVLSMRRVGVS